MGNDKKKKKMYYKNCAKGGQKGRSQLAAGMRGFLITCSNRAEKDAARDAFKLLSEYADKMYGPEFKEEEAGQSSDCEEDIEKALQQEVKDIKARKNTQRRFSNVEAGANGCIFIRTTLDKPQELLQAIVADIHKTKVFRSRFIMKMFPVVATCRADREKIKATASECLAEAFKGLTMFSYEVTIKIRNCTGLTKTTVLPLINDVILELNLPGKVKFGTSDYVISVDILKAMCCISVMKDFTMYKKYNLHEIAMAEKKDETSKNSTKRQLEEGSSNGGSGPKRRLSEENREKGKNQEPTVKKQEPAPVLDPFMSKIAGLIQTKVAEAPTSGDSMEGRITEALEKEEDTKEGDSKPGFSLSCPYVASSI